MRQDQAQASAHAGVRTHACMPRACTRARLRCTPPHQHAGHIHRLLCMGHAPEQAASPCWVLAWALAALAAPCKGTHSSYLKTSIAATSAGRGNKRNGAMPHACHTRVRAEVPCFFRQSTPVGGRRRSCRQHAPGPRPHLRPPPRRGGGPSWDRGRMRGKRGSAAATLDRVSGEDAMDGDACLLGSGRG